MSRRDHTAHDLASLRINLFGETAKSSFSQVFGHKARGTVDKRGNVLATAPFRRGKRKALEKDNTTQGSPGEPTISTVDDETLESSRPMKRRRTYYPSILPFLDTSESTDTPISRLGNGQPTAVSNRFVIVISLFNSPCNRISLKGYTGSPVSTTRSGACYMMLPKGPGLLLMGQAPGG